MICILIIIGLKKFFRLFNKYRDLKSEIKDIIVENNHIAFRVEQHAFFVPDDEYVNMDVINLYKLIDGCQRVATVVYSRFRFKY